MLCEVCGKEVKIYGEYIDVVHDKGRLFNPSEHLDVINNLSEEEQRDRRAFFTRLFSDHGFEVPA